MSETQYECLIVLDDGTTESTSLDEISDAEKTFLIRTGSKIYVLPTPSVRMSAIAQRAARNIRLANALRHDIELVPIGERETLQSAVASGTLISPEAPTQRPEITQAQPVLSAPSRPPVEVSGHVMREVTAREEVSEERVAPSVQIQPAELRPMAITDEDYLVRVFGAFLLGVPQKSVQALLSSSYHSEAQKTVFENKMRRLMQQFIENFG
ncbi:MAG: hypothetical protein ACXAB4_05690 [Candidatus Hodarchaeales archaeon]|jgi:hypothetical protein